jgi:hypothetical protein
MISIRRMNAQDVPAGRFLLYQLGYVLGSEEVRRRYDKVTSSQDHVLLEPCHGVRGEATERARVPRVRGMNRNPESSGVPDAAPNGSIRAMSAKWTTNRPIPEADVQHRVASAASLRGTT